MGGKRGMGGKLGAGDKLVLASHNRGKIFEFRGLLAPYGVEVIPARDLGVEEPEETGSTFAENARLKALVCAEAAGLPALADDSGLEIEALDGAPGIFSARWAGEERDFTLAMAKVEAELAAKSAKSLAAVTAAGRRANFICMLCLATPSGETELFEGKVYGHLRFPPTGENGFGYDPIFVPDGYDESFGEMDIDLKHRLSHRSRAFEKFMAAFLGGVV
jgi:XTP/dITP diphosphohydrolase